MSGSRVPNMRRLDHDIPGEMRCLNLSTLAMEPPIFWSIPTMIFCQKAAGPTRSSNRSPRKSGSLRIFVTLTEPFVPHRRWEPGDYEDWDHPSPTQRRVMEGHHFARGEWGGEWHPDFVPKAGDVIAKEHWGSRGFANTDLDYRLKQRGISYVIIAGLLANTCIETTARYATELGYHVTLVRDATAAFKLEMMYSAHELNGPTFAHAIVTTDELIASLPQGVSYEN